jgi:spore maturation protein A
VNGIFSVVFILASAVFLLRNPNGFLPSLLHGAEKAATLSLSLLAIDCVWLGFFQVMEQSGLQKKLSRRLLPKLKKLFRSEDEEALSLASGNLSANLLGLPGAPTPLGMKATERFMKQGNTYAANLLFVLNATSLQLLPTTVIALRTAYQSTSPADILLPTLLSTLCSTLLGYLLIRLTTKR